jgi:glycine hydroxymethyltransferase
MGTPAVTTRGMKEEEMRIIAPWIRRVLDHLEQEAVHREVRLQVAELCRRFPIYQYLDKKEE